MQFWNELEGQTIDGLFPLRRLVRSEGRSAWFETETPAPRMGRATISLTEALTDADEVTARLQAAQSLKHPNLVEIAQVGQVSIDSTQVVYAVMEPIEQSLSDVLQMQSLSAEEGREVAEAMVSALTAIHQRGMSHGRVEAASVLATEATVKLRSDCLQINASSQAADVAGVGSTLFHAFTQRKAANATDAQVNRIPAPFGEIVRNSLARRWSLAQIANALKPTPPVATPLPVVVSVPIEAPEPVAAKPATPVPISIAPPPPPLAAAPTAPPAPRPVGPAPSTVQQAALFPEALEPALFLEKRRPLALYGVIAVLAVALFGWVVMRRPSTPASTSSAPAVSQAPAAAAPPVAAAAVPAAKPAAAVAASRQQKRVPATSDSAAAGAAATPSSAAATPKNDRSIWRVVVYTYKGQSKAAQSVARIQNRHPDLQPSVFNPSGSDSYMVTLGGPMDHPHAKEMLAKARREGLPGDTFVRNFSE